MPKFVTLVLLMFFTSAASAQDAGEAEKATDAALIISAEDVDLNEFLWKNRPLIVFADSPADPRFIQQMEFIAARPEDLVERDIIVLTDTDPAAKSALRQKFRPRGFMLMLVGKDGIRYLRKPFPWDVREISRSVDKLPTRRREIRDALNGS